MCDVVVECGYLQNAKRAISAVSAPLLCLHMRSYVRVSLRLGPRPYKTSPSFLLSGSVVVVAMLACGYQTHLVESQHSVVLLCRYLVRSGPHHECLPGFFFSASFQC